jgi:hypothetical protein
MSNIPKPKGYQQSELVKGYYPDYFIIDVAQITFSRRIAIIPRSMDIQECCKKNGLLKRKYELVINGKSDLDNIEMLVTEKIKIIEKGSRR